MKRGYTDYSVPIAILLWGVLIASLFFLCYFGETFGSPPPSGQGSSMAQDFRYGVYFGLLLMGIGIASALRKYLRNKRRPREHD